MRLPENYTGAVVHVTEKDAPKDTIRERSNPEDGEDEDEDMDEDVEMKVAEKVAEFEEMIVWGHGDTIDESEDVYARGMKEWIGFAEAMNREDEDDEGEQSSKKS
jgi:ribonuclease H2 subunit C